MSDVEQQPERQVASDAEEEEEHVPAHDITATTVSGSRVRRSTQKFTVDEPKADDTDDFQPPMGKGTKIKDIALVNDIVRVMYVVVCCCACCLAAVLLLCCCCGVLTV